MAVDPGGTALPTDQRGTGFPRIVDGNADSTATVDIGAFESPLITTSVSLSGGNLLISDALGDDTNDTLTIQSDSTNFHISDPNNLLGLTAGIAGATGHGTHTVTVPIASVTGTQILVHTLGGNDSLTVDFSDGNFTKTITYDGGNQNGTPGDSLTLTGGPHDGDSFTIVTHTLTNANDGSVSIADGTSTQTITYIGLEPVTDNLSATDRAFTFNGGAETITLTDANGAAMTIDSALSESVTFANPTDSLTINAGSGNDTVNITSVDADGPFNAALTINGDAGNDTINLNADITFAANMDLNVDLTDDASEGDVDTILVGTNTNLILAGTGAAILKASKNIALASGSSLTTVNGGITLSANASGMATGNFNGLDANNATIQTTGTGNIVLQGHGGADEGSGTHFGVFCTRERR